MYRDSLIPELRELIEGYLKDQGVVLVDFACLRSGRDLVLRVLADYPTGGIDVATCTRLNRQLGVILDEKDILTESYHLEVSSPGLDRPLKTKADFLRCLNRQAVFFLSQPLQEKIEWQGVIKEVTEEAVCIAAPAGELRIPLSAINKAKQVIK